MADVAVVSSYYVRDDRGKHQTGREGRGGLVFRGQQEIIFPIGQREGRGHRGGGRRHANGVVVDENRSVDHICVSALSGRMGGNSGSHGRTLVINSADGVVLILFWCRCIVGLACKGCWGDAVQDQSCWVVSRLLRVCG